MIALDASVLIAYLNPADPHHSAATALLLATTPDEMIVHPITLAEVLVGGVRIDQGAAMRNGLFAVGIALAGPDEGQPLRLAELRVGTGLKMPDCCVLDVALTQRARLATFDTALARHARTLGVAVLRTDVDPSSP